MKKIIAVLACAVGLFGSVPAHAALFRADFTVRNLYEPFDRTPAPYDPIQGSILFRAESLGAEVQSIEGIDLVIGDHTYTKDEIGGASFLSELYFFGAAVNGVFGVSSGTNDFFISLSTGDSFNPTFVYAQPGRGENWITHDIAARFTEQVAEVPEPASLALLLAGAGGFGLLRRRRKA